MIFMALGIGVIVLSFQVFSVWPGLLGMCSVPIVTLLAKNFLYRDTLGSEPTILVVIFFTVIPFVVLWDWLGD